jgi:hypothetical protein
MYRVAPSARGGTIVMLVCPEVVASATRASATTAEGAVGLWLQPIKEMQLHKQSNKNRRKSISTV